MKKQKQLDFVATEIIEMLKERGASEHYVNEKIERLGGCNRFEVLVWCNNLDTDNKTALAHRFGISLDSFVQMIETMRKF